MCRTSFAEEEEREETPAIVSVKGGAVVSLSLPPPAGATKRTGSKPGHVSWWRGADFDPVPFAQPVS